MRLRGWRGCNTRVHVCSCKSASCARPLFVCLGLFFAGSARVRVRNAERSVIRASAHTRKRSSLISVGRVGRLRAELLLLALRDHYCIAGVRTCVCVGEMECGHAALENASVCPSVCECVF